ncbi:hypothetical protein [Erythrobacter sp. JK5]|uniref:hypothetical protein n=1 Tax=Erythrobacter sp. JK5 TaxID=2829500 RepID=UPI001BAE1F80|nr:hypothetical protein [Erythrobacter sp. JK5]QUL37028.1 hypothetical protein KDC96_11565 [Erythrobacter sp. JK5]
MTYGTFIPLLFGLMALADFPVIVWLRNTNRIAPGPAALLMLCALSLPLIVYVILNVAVPDIGARILY